MAASLACKKSSSGRITSGHTGLALLALYCFRFDHTVCLSRTHPVVSQSFTNDSDRYASLWEKVSFLSKLNAHGMKEMAPFVSHCLNGIPPPSRNFFSSSGFSLHTFDLNCSNEHHSWLNTPPFLRISLPLLMVCSVYHMYSPCNTSGTLFSPPLLTLLTSSRADLACLPEFGPPTTGSRRSTMHSDTSSMYTVPLLR